jgi:hypothetical protein
MIIDSKLSFAPGKLLLTFLSYSGNGRTCIQAVDPKTYEPITKLTVNVPDCDLQPGEILIKSWGENEGAYKTLEEAGLVELVQEVQCGYETAEKCLWLGKEEIK